MNILFDAIQLDKIFPFGLSNMKLPPFDNMRGIMHWHECFEISTIIEGSGIYRVEDKTYDVLPNDIVIINNIDPHCLHVGSEGMRQIVLISKVQFLFLPPYSPDFNPIERVWRITRRRRTHNRYFDSLKSLKDTLFSFFHSLYLPNEMLRSLCK